jgi:phosphotransferase system enzyme I (PtsI)
MKAPSMPSRSSAKGTVASIGYASGPLFEIDLPAISYAGSGNADTEGKRLRQALETAAAEIATLVKAESEQEAGILEFQQAMIEDETLSAPALATIASGTDAAAAWSAALATEIAGYETSDNAYFRARSADLVDIRDRVLHILSGTKATSAPAGAILFGRDLTPTQFLSTDWKGGGAIVLREGSPASHVAMLARARGVPMIVGIGTVEAANDDVVLVDAEHGKVTVLPDTDDRHEFLKASTEYRLLMASARTLLDKPSVTADNVPVEVFVNIAEPADVDHLDVTHCDGVGLMRTEFLYGRGLPDEETQLAAYRKVLEWARGKPVTVRTVDAGGDKPVPGFTIEETNPFLGLRGIRLCLERPDIFRIQIRALLRAAPAGNLKVMFPMISLAAEYHAAKSMFVAEANELGLPVPPLGIMVEVPAVAIAPEPFVDVAFASIGSNDLTQYVMAAARDNGAVAALNDPRHAAVLSLIRGVAVFGKANGIPVSLCGDAGGDPAVIPHLLHAGLRQLSVAPAQLALAKAAIAQAHAHG